MFHQLIKPAIVIFSLTVPLWFILRLIVKSYHKDRHALLSKHELILFLFYVYTIFVLLVTVVPIPMTRHATPNFSRVNFVPVVNTFKQFVATFSHGASFRKILMLENVLGNVILFFPLGVLLPKLSARFYSFKNVIGVAFLFSFSIELVQFISKHFGNYRSVDIDDVILNTVGAALGYIIAGRLFVEHTKQQ